MIILAIIFLIVFALFLSSSLGLRHKLAFLVSMFLLTYANLVIVSEAASLLHQMNKSFFLFAHGILALAAWLVWKRRGKPNLLGPFRDLPYYKWNFSVFSKNADLSILGIIVGLVYLAGIFLILFTPQNNFDSMTYHLSRVGYWLQHQSLFPWNSPNPRQTSFPINAELGLLWTIVFWGSDQLTGFVQWSAFLVISITIFGFSKLLGASRKQGIFAALIWATFPQIFLQSTTTMNDLVVTAFFSSAIYLGFLGLRENNRNYLILAGLGIGLAMGTKSTAFILLPSFVIGMGLVLILNWKVNIKNLLIWGIASLVAFGLVGSLGYIQNDIYYHNPFSVSQWTEGLVNAQTSRFEFLFENSLLYFNQAIDWTGLPPFISQPLAQFQAKIVQKFISYLPFANADWFIDGRQNLNFILYSPKIIHEDLAWFGPLFLLLAIPTSLYHLIIGIKRRDGQRLALLILTWGFVLTMCLLMSWTPYKGRYFTLAITFCAPLLAVLYQSSKRWFLPRWIIVLLAASILSFTFLYNQSKPILGERSIFGKDPLTVRTINNRGMEPVLRMVERNVPAESRMATKLSVNSWDYPLFENYFQRTIIQVDPFSTSIDPEWIREQAIDYLLIEPKERFSLAVPPGFKLIDSANGWTLYTLCSEAQCQPNPEIASQLIGASDKDRLLTIAPELVGDVGVLELRPNAWGIEQLDGQGILWLGEGPLHGLTGYLWAETPQSVQILVEVEPGPSKANPESTLKFSLYPVIGYEYNFQDRTLEERQFDKPTTLAFSVHLNQGLNEFQLSSRDLADFRNSANGDTRPLLILVKHITVEELP